VQLGGNENTSQCNRPRPRRSSIRDHIAKKNISDREQEVAIDHNASVEANTAQQARRNGEGKAIPLHGPMKYHIHVSLHDRAFEKAYVTANFSKYILCSSPIAFCVMAKTDVSCRTL